MRKCRPSPGGSSGIHPPPPAPAPKPETTDFLQAILSVAQRLEDKLAELPARPLQLSTMPACAPAADFELREWPRQQGAECTHAQQASDDCTQSSSRSAATPSSSVLSGSTDSLPSAWGVHASKKLRKLLRQKQPPSSVVGEQAGGQVGFVSLDAETHWRLA